MRDALLTLAALGIILLWNHIGTKIQKKRKERHLLDFDLRECLK